MRYSDYLLVFKTIVYSHARMIYFPLYVVVVLKCCCVLPEEALKIVKIFFLY